MKLTRDELVTIHQALDLARAQTRLVLGAEKDEERIKMYVKEVSRLMSLANKIMENYPENLK